MRTHKVITDLGKGSPTAHIEFGKLRGRPNEHVTEFTGEPPNTFYLRVGCEL